MKRYSMSKSKGSMINLHNERLDHYMLCSTSRCRHHDDAMDEHSALTCRGIPSIPSHDSHHPWTKPDKYQL